MTNVIYPPPNEPAPDATTPEAVETDASPDEGLADRPSVAGERFLAKSRREDERFRRAGGVTA